MACNHKYYGAKAKGVTKAMILEQIINMLHKWKCGGTVAPTGKHFHISESSFRGVKSGSPEG
jgi:hypothetical protein